MAKRGRVADCDEPPEAPNPDGGPLPHYRRGGRAKKHVGAEGAKARRRLDRAGRARGGRGSDWTPKKDFHPGGEKGKLHRELGIPEDEKIPADRLSAATRSRDPEIRRDAIRAKTMEKWH